MKPNKLPSRTWDETKASAQRILDLRGQPPYDENSFDNGAEILAPSPDELRVISEFVQFWLPFLTEKPKIKQPQVGKGQEGME